MGLIKLMIDIFKIKFLFYSYPLEITAPAFFGILEKLLFQGEKNKLLPETDMFYSF